MDGFYILWPNQLWSWNWGERAECVCVSVSPSGLAWIVRIEFENTKPFVLEIIWIYRRHVIHLQRTTQLIQIKNSDMEEL